MIAIKPTRICSNFKRLCDRAVKGETIIVPRPNNKNVVIVSHKKYIAMEKAAKNGDYLAMLDRSMAELSKGGFQKTLDELRSLEQ